MIHVLCLFHVCLMPVATCSRRFLLRPCQLIQAKLTWHAERRKAHRVKKDYERRMGYFFPWSCFQCFGSGNRIQRWILDPDPYKLSKIALASKMSRQDSNPSNIGLPGNSRLQIRGSRSERNTNRSSTLCGAFLMAQVGSVQSLLCRIQDNF